MECSQNDVDNDFAGIRNQSSEVDVCMDGVIGASLKDKNELDILSNLMTAIDSSMSNVSVHTAMSVMTVETDLNAYADPPLDRRTSFSMTSEMCSEETFDDEIYFNGIMSPLKVEKNENGIVGFEMMCDGGKVSVVDSMECLAHLDSFSPEPVHFDPRVYLGISFPSDDVDFHLDQDAAPCSEISSEDLTTAPLGPSFDEFPQYLVNSKELNEMQ